MKDILATITKYREERNWTEYQLAERSGLPQSTISSWYRILRISHNTAYALVRSGQIHSVRTGRNYRIPINAVVDYLKKN